MTTYKTIAAGEATVSYIEGGDAKRPTLLLLHGFPTSSNQFRNLIPLLSTKYHVLAPDLPGFGHTILPDNYTTNFASIATTVIQFLDALKIESFAVYIFDYGSPTAFRLALERPNAIKAIITQNGNAYEDGLSPAWEPLKAWWKTQKGTKDFDDAAGAVKSFTTLEFTKFQYVHGSGERADRIDPNTYTLDYHLNIKDRVSIQEGLLYDYQNNVALYPKFQGWLRQSKVPVLAVWGKNDPFFTPPGAEAYGRDAKDFKMELLDGGHFLLETHLHEVSELMLEWLGERLL